MTIYSFEWGGVEEKDLRMNGTGLQSTDVCVSLLAIEGDREDPYGWRLWRTL